MKAYPCFLSSCRLHDQAPAYTRSHSYTSALPSTSPPASPYSRHFSSLGSITTYSPDDGPDIIPRFSPTQSRPRSYYNSESYPSSYHAPLSSSPPTTGDHHSATSSQSRSSTALASLRELATALPKTASRNRDPESPPKSSASSMNGVWNYIPFASSSHTYAKTTSSPTPTPTPGNSYTNSQGYTASQSYGAYNTTQDYGYGKSAGTGGGYAAGYAGTGGMGMDRPLPPRSGPGGYGHRPRSIDLVTPFPGGH
jgi:hypothetical protein